MMKIKICGIRRSEDTSYINEYLPDYCGFILSAGFRRSISKEEFFSLETAISRKIIRVGVFVNEDIKNVLCYADKLNVIQLHGNEDNDYIKILKENCSCEIWKAVRARCTDDIEYADKLDCDKLLIDSYTHNTVGGSGKTADFNVIKNAQFSKPFLLAGGLDKDNIFSAIKAVYPHIPIGVDFSSSVETNGVKDKIKIAQTITAIRGGIYNE